MARAVMEQILKTGKVTRGYLGVMIQEVTPELAKAFDLPSAEGALVGDVTPDSPGAKAGLQKGDVIITLNGQPYLRLHRPAFARLAIGARHSGEARGFAQRAKARDYRHAGRISRRRRKLPQSPGRVRARPWKACRLRRSRRRSPSS